MPMEEDKLPYALRCIGHSAAPNTSKAFGATVAIVPAGVNEGICDKTIERI